MWKHTGKVSETKTMNICMFDIKKDHSTVMLDLEITVNHRLKQPMLNHRVYYSVDSTTNNNNSNNTI